MTEKRQRNPAMLLMGVIFIGWSVYKGGWWWLMTLPVGISGLVIGLGREDLFNKFTENVGSPVSGAIDRIWNLIPEPPFHHWFVETKWAASYREFFQKNPAGFYVAFLAAASSLWLPKFPLSPSEASHYGWGYAIAKGFLAYFAYLLVRSNYPVENWRRAILWMIIASAVFGFVLLGTRDESEDQDPIGPHVAQTVTDFEPTTTERVVITANDVIVMLWGAIVGTIAGPQKRTRATD